MSSKSTNFQNLKSKWIVLGIFLGIILGFALGFSFGYVEGIKRCVDIGLRYMDIEITEQGKQALISWIRGAT